MNKGDSTPSPLAGVGNAMTSHVEKAIFKSFVIHGAAPHRHEPQGFRRPLNFAE